jgi:hypothetical protein
LQVVEIMCINSIAILAATQIMVEMDFFAGRSTELQSATLLARLPALGTLERKKIATLVGGAPYNRGGGKMKGKRAISGGRGDVRARST